MRRLWECNDWSTFVSEDCRKGIRLYFDRDVDKEVKRASKDFVDWLAEQYEFPIRIPIYFKTCKHIISRNGEEASAAFLGPFDKREEPYIRIAVGDYQELKGKRGQDNALASILHSIAHELTHYYQWVKNSDCDIAKMERQAQYYAREILYDYAEIREHP